MTVTEVVLDPESSMPAIMKPSNEADNDKDRLQNDVIMAEVHHDPSIKQEDEQATNGLSSTGADKEYSGMYINNVNYIYINLRILI